MKCLTGVKKTRYSSTISYNDSKRIKQVSWDFDLEWYKRIVEINVTELIQQRFTCENFSYS